MKVDIVRKSTTQLKDVCEVLNLHYKSKSSPKDVYCLDDDDIIMKKKQHNKYIRNVKDHNDEFSLSSLNLRHTKGFDGIMADKAV